MVGGPLDRLEKGRRAIEDRIKVRQLEVTKTKKNLSGDSISGKGTGSEDLLIR